MKYFVDIDRYESNFVHLKTLIELFISTMISKVHYKIKLKLNFTQNNTNMQQQQTQELAYFRAQAARRQTIHNEISVISNDIANILKTLAKSEDKKEIKIEESPLLLACTATISQLEETIDEEVQEEEEQTPVDIEVSEQSEQIEQAVQKVEKKKSVSGKSKVKILKPIKEEESTIKVDIEAYKRVFKRCHEDLKTMKIG